MTPVLSVVIPTFNRGALLRRVLDQLEAQTLPPAQFEVLVVDDGSADPAARYVDPAGYRYPLRLERQENAGAAAARHRGAMAAQGRILVFLDDDMQVGPEFLAAHLALHQASHRVVIGRIEGDPGLAAMPLFERWHQHLLDRLARDVASGRTSPRGTLLFSGNVSMPAEDYRRVGGFRRDLAQTEDVELGLRLEEAGCAFVFGAQAASRHGSNHDSQEFWFRRAFRYGECDRRVAEIHPSARHANPWRLLRETHLLTRPLLLAAVAFPRAGEALARGVMNAAGWLDRAGLEAPALRGMSVAYSMQYFRGLRSTFPHGRSAWQDAQRYLRSVEPVAVVSSAEAVR